MSNRSLAREAGGNGESTSGRRAAHQLGLPGIPVVDVDRVTPDGRHTHHQGLFEQIRPGIIATTHGR